jgi:hypothetical protein
MVKCQRRDGVSLMDILSFVFCAGGVAYAQCLYLPRRTGHKRAFSASTPNVSSVNVSSIGWEVSAAASKASSIGRQVHRRACFVRSSKTFESIQNGSAKASLQALRLPAKFQLTVVRVVRPSLVSHTFRTRQSQYGLCQEYVGGRLGMQTEHPA